MKIWADTTDPTVGATRFEEARRNIAAAAPEQAPPPEQVRGSFLARNSHVTLWKEESDEP